LKFSTLGTKVVKGVLKFFFAIYTSLRGDAATITAMGVPVSVILQAAIPNVIRIRMPNAMLAYPLHNTNIPTPNQFPFPHMMVGGIMNNATAPLTVLGAMYIC
jgi:hypothetical protein